MSMDIKKVTIVGAILLSSLLLASCNWEKPETIMDDNKTTTETDSMMEDDTNTMMSEDTINKEWTEEEKNMMKDEDTMMKDEDTMMKDEDTMMKDEDTMMGAGTYTDYSQEKLANTSGDIVLFFHATWCPSCKSANENLSSETIPENLTILKLDYDSNTDLRKKYGITSQHTFVKVDNEGTMIKKWVGSRNISDIMEQL